MYLDQLKIRQRSSVYDRGMVYVYKDWRHETPEGSITRSMSF